MKKKLLIFILFILLIPITVRAEDGISIKSITLLNKSDEVEVLNEASYTASSISFDLKMYSVNDYASYKVIVENTTSNKMRIKSNFNNANEHMKYEVIYQDNDPYIEGNAEKEITIKVSLDKEISSTLFRNGSYDASDNLSLLLTDNLIDVANTLKNISPVIVILLITMIIIGIVFLIKNNKVSKTQTLVILLFVMIAPTFVKADRVFELNVVAKVSVQKAKPNPCTFEGNLVQGAQYINGQYTYRYMLQAQQFDNQWSGINNDGWGVVLTDRSSTDPVTSELCSTINGKPIVTMANMFHHSSATSIDLSSFVTNEVVNMNGMFANLYNVKSLNLSTFNTSKVTDMSYMFNYSKTIEDVDINTLDFSSVTNMSYMFYETIKLKKIEIDSNNMENINYIYRAFYHSGDEAETFEFILKNNSFNSLIDGTYAFGGIGYNVKNAKITIENISFPEMTTAYQLFAYISHNVENGEISIKNIDLPKSTDVQYAFAYIGNNVKNGILYIDNISMPEALNAGYIFYSMLYNGYDQSTTIKNIDLPKATNCDSAFQYISNNSDGDVVLNISNINMKSATSANYLTNRIGYWKSDSLTMNVSDIDLSNATNVIGIFNEEGTNTTGDVNLSFKNINVSKASSASGLLQYAGQRASNVSITIDNFNASSATSSNYFLERSGYDASGEVTVKIKDLNLSNCTNADYMFEYIGYNANKVSFDVDNVNLKSATSIQSLFTQVAYSSENIDIKINNLDIRSAANIDYIFNMIGYNPKDVKIVITNLNAESATSADSTFIATGQCGGSPSGELTKVNILLENWNLKNVVNVRAMFENVGKSCNETTFKMKNIDFSSLKSTSYMFHKFSSYSETSKAEFENITAPNVENVSNMFIYSGQYANTWEIKGINQFLSNKTTNFYQTFYYTRFQGNAMRDYGTMDIYGGSLSGIFYNNERLKVTLNLRGNVSNITTIYGGAFYNAAITEDSEVILNYTSDVDIDTIMANVSSNPNIKKGSLIED